MPTISKRVYCKADKRIYADLKVTFSEQNVNVGNNTSEVKYSYTFKQYNSITYTGADRSDGASIQVIINGSEVLDKTVGLKKSAVSYSGSGTKTITHNTDGSKSIKVGIDVDTGDGNFDGDNWVYGGIDPVYSTMTLKTIARASYINSIVGDKVFGTKLTLDCYQYDAAFNCTYWYRFNGVTDWVKIADKVEASASFTIPLTLASKFPTKKSAVMELCVETFTNDGTKVGKGQYKDVTIKVPSYSVTATALEQTITNPTTMHSTFRSNTILTNYTSLTYTRGTTTSSYGATIKTYSLTDSGTGSTTSGTSLTFNPTKAGTFNVTSTATDTRGVSASKKLSYTAYSYREPNLTINAIRCNANGAEDIMGTYVKVTPTWDTHPVDGRNREYGVKYTINNVSIEKLYPDASSEVIINANLAPELGYKMTVEYRDFIFSNNRLTLTIDIPSAAVIFNSARSKRDYGIGCYAGKMDKGTMTPNTRLCIGSRVYTAENFCSYGAHYAKLFKTYGNSPGEIGQRPVGQIMIGSRDLSGSGGRKNIWNIDQTSSKDGFQFMVVGDNTPYYVLCDKTSDISTKHSIRRNTDSVSEKIRNIEFYDFYYTNKDNDKEINGFIANQLQDIDKDYVTELDSDQSGKGKVLVPKNNKIFTDALKALQEAYNKIDELEARIAKLEEK